MKKGFLSLFQGKIERNEQRIPFVPVPIQPTTNSASLPKPSDAGNQKIAGFK